MKERTLTGWAYGVVVALLVAGVATGHPTPRPADHLRDRLLSYSQCYAAEMQLQAPWVLRVVFGQVEPTDTLHHFEAGTFAEPAYFRATITYDTLSDLPSLSDSGLRQTVVHELTHVWLWQLVELGSGTNAGLATRWNEQTATLVSRWPLWQSLCR